MPSPPRSDAASPLLLREVSLAHVPAGLCEPTRTDSYRLSVNTGAAVWGTCRDPGRGRRYLRHPGSINFAPAGSTVSWLIESPIRLLKLSLSRTLINTAAREQDLEAKALDFQCAIQVREAQIEWLARALHREVSSGSPNGLLFSESLGLALSIVLIQKFARATPVPAGMTGQLTPIQLKRISDYVHDNLSRQDLSLSELASVAGTSVSHFKALFSRSVGMPAHRFVVKCRIERAAALLRRGDSSISDIAAETGFSHASHLARWTRRLLGVSPGELKKG